MTNKIKAYAIFAGGGVKGTAFAGCLEAAEQFGFEFVGYAGASAGSIAAALACAGYNAEEMSEILAETNYHSFFDNEGKDLKMLMQSVSGFNMSLKSLASLPVTFFKNRKSLETIKQNFGLYEGEKLKTFLRSKINKKLGKAEDSEIYFGDLPKPLKVIVSDVVKNKPIVFSKPDKHKKPKKEDESGVPVVDAVLASSSFPFIFKPIQIDNKGELLVDGGLSCNLPFFAFEEERRLNNLPVIAFNLIPETTNEPPENLMAFCSDMINTALESSEALLHQFLQGIYIVQIKTNVKTFELDLDEEKRDLLYNAGFKDSTTYFNENLKEWQQADTRRERLQALYAPPYIVEPVLASVAKEFEAKTPCQDVRATIGLPNRFGKKIMAYYYGFQSDDLEVELELDLTAGSTGMAWEQREPTFADLEYAKANPAEFNMTKAQTKLIRADRKAIMSVPIFHLKREAGRMSELEPFGILSIDTSTPLAQTGWLEKDSCQTAVDLLKKWSDVISYVLKGSL